MRDQSLFTSYDQAWSYIYDEPGVREKADAWLAEQFPPGTGLRILVEKFYEHVRELRETPSHPLPRGQSCFFHPRALEFLLEHGREYLPDTSKVEFFRNYPDAPHLGKCFTNSWLWMEAVNRGATGDRRLVYVEGLTFGYFGAVGAVLHAWNSYGVDDDRAADWSHYPWCAWNRYYGFALTDTEHAAIQQHLFPEEPRASFCLFDIEFFPLVETKLYEVLAARKPPA